MPPRSKTHSKSSKAGLVFPVGTIGRHMREGRDGSGRVSTKASVYYTASIEFFAAYIIEESAKHARLASKGEYKITPQHVKLAIDGSADLRRLLRWDLMPRPVGQSGEIQRVKKTKE
jgi:histone H2A